MRPIRQIHLQAYQLKVGKVEEKIEVGTYRRKRTLLGEEEYEDVDLGIWTPFLFSHIFAIFLIST